MLIHKQNADVIVVHTAAYMSIVFTCLWSSHIQVRYKSLALLLYFFPIFSIPFLIKRIVIIQYLDVELKGKMNYLILVRK